MGVCLHGEKEVVQALFKFLGITHNEEQTHYKSINHKLCAYALGNGDRINKNIKVGTEKNILIGLIELIQYSLHHFQIQYTKEQDILDLIGKIIIDYIDKGYCYVWYNNKITKYSIGYGKEPTKLVKTYYIESSDDKYIKIKGFEESIPIKSFIKKPSRKPKQEDNDKQGNGKRKEYKNDYQRYINFYNLVNDCVMNIDGKYCPVCNPYGKKPKNKRTGKEVNSKFCPTCKKLYNEIASKFGCEEAVLKRFRQNISIKIPKMPLDKIYEKRLNTCLKSLYRELARIGELKKDPKGIISDDDLKAMSKDFYGLKKSIVERFTIKD